jgi:hypothetical protein
MGVKQGFQDLLISFGVTPISIEDGIASYLDLVQYPRTGSTFVITGLLVPEFESILFPPTPKYQTRFLERILLWVPGTVIVAEASLSHHTDLYLPDHVLKEIPIFPGIMAIEAMVEAAVACNDRSDLPVLRNIYFNKALVIPKNAVVNIRTIALADLPDGDIVRVRVVMQSELDNFSQNHFELECFFGEPTSKTTDHPPFSSLSEPLEIDPELLHPLPLFQGKFFRNVTSIYKLNMLKESITKVKVPDCLRYFNRNQKETIIIPYPAANDAFFQSGAIALPEIFLPTKIEEFRFFQRSISCSMLVCQARILSVSNGEAVSNVTVFTQNGDLVEIMKGVVLKAPGVGERKSSSLRRSSVPINIQKGENNLQDFLLAVHYTLGFVDHKELENLTTLKEISPRDIEFIGSCTPLSRKATILAKLVAARRAAKAFARRKLKLDISPTQVFLSNQAGPKPELRFDDASIGKAFQDIHVGIADASGVTAALVGPAPFGIDIKAVEDRNGKAWIDLIGGKGYAQAYHVVAQGVKPFERAATYIWSMLEAGRKAHSLKKVVPTFETHLDDHWLSFRAQSGKLSLNFFCASLETSRYSSPELVLSVALNTQKVERNSGDGA